MWPLTLAEIAARIGAAAPPVETAARPIRGLQWWSEPARADGLVVAYPMPDVDTHAVIAERLAEGQGAAIVRADWLRGASLAPEVAAACLPVEDPFVAMRALAARARRGFVGPVVAVGGSAGKTTTKEMIAAALGGPGRRVVRSPGNNNGWIGVSYTLLLADHAREAPPDAVVVEIGIDAPGAMARHAEQVAPDLAVLTALGEEHLRGFGSARVAADEEARLFDRAAARVWLLDDPEIAERAGAARPEDVLVSSRAETLAGARARTLAFAIAPGEGPLEHRVRYTWRDGGRVIEGEILAPAPGRHNATNSALAVAAALALGRSPDAIAAGLAAFVAPDAREGGRSRRAAIGDGLLLDDAYNACPGSVRAALAMLADASLGARPRVAVLADMLDLGEASATLHEGLADAARAIPDLHLVLVGEAMRALYEVLLADEPRAAIALAHVPTPEPDRVMAALAACEAPLAGAAVLVKGSRGNRLERVVARIEAAMRSE